GDHLGQALPLDELHRIKMRATLAADVVHRHDVRVVQLRRGVRFIAKALQLPRIHRSGKRQDLQRHLPAERDLLRLVADTHAAPADFAEDAEITENSRTLGRIYGGEWYVEGERGSHGATQGFGYAVESILVSKKCR